jgi:serine/threonine-protein kinase
MPPIQIGPYRIVRPLGEGGMGAVYEAIQEPIQRRVAIKLLLPQYGQNRDVLARFFNEARVVNLIEHPSIVQISDYGQTEDGTAYLVMEYLHGETLSGRLDRLRRAGERLRPVKAVQLAAQIADALAAAHKKAIVHRDLKPANVMLVRDSAVAGSERAKILDFGIAKLTQGQAKGTANNLVMGTPQYMSPEQCRGAGLVDDKTDVYALGVMLFEMLAGRPPFLAENAVEYMSQHVFSDPPPLIALAKDLPANVAALVHRLLHKDKTARPAMDDIRTELCRLLSELSDGTMERPPDAVPPLPRRKLAPPTSPSTLGGSPGQSLWPARPPTAGVLRRVALFVGFGAIVMSTFLILRGWIGRQTPARTPAVSLSLPMGRPLRTSHGSLDSPRALPPRGPVAAPMPELPPQPRAILAVQPPAAAPTPQLTSPHALRKPSHRPGKGPKPLPATSATTRALDYEL